MFLAKLRLVGSFIQYGWMFDIKGRVNLGFQLRFSFSTNVPCRKNKAQLREYVLTGIKINVTPLTLSW